MLIALAGLPASGKSALAMELQRELNAVVLDKDKVRQFLFTDYVDYSNYQNDLCLDVIYQVATYLLTLPNPPVVILDGRTYSKSYQVNAVKRTAQLAGAELYIIECVCSERTAQQRLNQDQGVHLAKDRDFDMYLKSKAGAESIAEPKLIIETDKHPPAECKELALRYLRSIC